MHTPLSTPFRCVLAGIALASFAVPAQATDTSHRFIANGAANWSTGLTATRWSNTLPWTLPPPGGPNATSRLDMAGVAGHSLQSNTDANRAVQELTVSVATVQQLIQFYTVNSTLTIGNAVSKNGLLSVDTAGLSLFANTGITFDVVLNGNANVASGANLSLGYGAANSNVLTSFTTTGTMTINGSVLNSHTSTNANFGDLVMGSSGSLAIINYGATPTVNSSFDTTLQARSLSGTGTINGTTITGSVAGAGTGNRVATLLINTATSSNATFAGVISNGVTALKGTNTTNLLVSGSGRQTLTGENTYTGSTSITGGTLILAGAGSINTSSGITINGGAFKSTSSTALTRNVTLTSGTFGYSSSGNYTGVFTHTAGTLEGTNWNGGLNNQVIGAGKTISPGNSPGTASTGGQTWASGGALNWEINDATGTAGTNWDQILLSDALSIAATSGDTFTINILSLAGLVAGDAANFDSSLSDSWLLADASSEISSFVGNKFTLNLAGFSNDYDGTWAIVRGDSGGFGDSSQLFISYNAVPEPSTYAMFGLGGLGLLALLRRRSIKSRK